MTDPELIIVHATLLNAVDAAFLEPAPDIDVLAALGHRELAGEAEFNCFAARKADCPDPIRFYARAVALTWGDTYVFDDGTPLPGRRALPPEGLAWPSYQGIRKDIVHGGSRSLCRPEMPALRSILSRMSVCVDRAAAGPVVRAQDMVAEWNLHRTIWESSSHWALAEWGTSA